MAGLSGFRSLPPKAKNLVVAGGLTAFVFGTYYYTMRAVGGTDELQVAIDKFEAEKSKTEGDGTSMPSKGKYSITEILLLDCEEFMMKSQVGDYDACKINFATAFYCMKLGQNGITRLR
ncbi:hypothetical protein AHAS_Ahas02G0079200 [Arachis hypogaea]